ncbi:MAG: MFS transporter [Candidatus Obscuribacter sp.]|nr:MFS transporter [Candidatus Obscuribacter sp.]
MNNSIVHRILAVRALRAFADGYVSLLLPVYLISLGMSTVQIGVVATGTLFGSGVLTLLVGLHARRFNNRTLLFMASMLMTLTGFGFAAITDFWPLLVIAIVGTLNPSSGDVSVFLPLEHALLATSVEDRQRTHSFARYSLIGALLAAAGALFAGLPDLVVATLHIAMKTALQAMFVLYGLLGLLSALIYASLPEEQHIVDRKPTAHLQKSKKVVYMLAALFCIDAFGGGLVVQSMVALWLFQKFHLSIVVAGQVFFWAGLFSAFSYLAAVRIANRFGLMRTMVFTHLPSSIFLVLIPFMPTLTWAIVLLLARGALSQMDVPTRSSYVMAIVTPEERAAAASVTSIPRSLASAAGPWLAGYLLGLSSFGWPLIVAGGMKIAYDLLLFAKFRAVRPPEEKPTPP